MGFLKENIFKLILLTIGVVVLLFASNYFTVNKKFYERMMEERIERYYSGIVIAKYIDESDHSTPKLKLTNNSVISLENTFWNKVEIGDSIVKIKKQRLITLYKKNNQIVIFDYNIYFKNLKEKLEKKR